MTAPEQGSTDAYVALHDEAVQVQDELEQAYMACEDEALASVLMAAMVFARKVARASQSGDGGAP
jgi:hypothetical protein